MRVRARPCGGTCVRARPCEGMCAFPRLGVRECVRSKSVRARGRARAHVDTAPPRLRIQATISYHIISYHSGIQATTSYHIISYHITVRFCIVCRISCVSPRDVGNRGTERHRRDRASRLLILPREHNFIDNVSKYNIVCQYKILCAII